MTTAGIAYAVVALMFVYPIALQIGKKLAKESTNEAIHFDQWCGALFLGTLCAVIWPAALLFLLSMGLHSIFTEGWRGNNN